MHEMNESLYRSAVSEYEKTVNNIKLIIGKKDPSKTIEEKVQFSREIITELSKNREILEKCQNIIIEYEYYCSDILKKIGSLFNSTFPDNLKKIDTISQELSKNITHNENSLAYRISNELDGDHPDIMKLQRLIYLLMGNRPQFIEDKRKITELFNELSNIQSNETKNTTIEDVNKFIKDYIINKNILSDRPMLHTAPEYLDNKIALLSIKIQEKMLKSLKQLSDLYHQGEGAITFKECWNLQVLEELQLQHPKKLNISEQVIPMLKNVSEDKRPSVIHSINILASDKTGRNNAKWNNIIRLYENKIPNELILKALLMPTNWLIDANVNAVIKLHENQIPSEIISEMIEKFVLDDPSINDVIKLYENKIPSEIILKMIKDARVGHIYSVSLRQPSEMLINAVIKLHENQIPSEIILNMLEYPLNLNVNAVIKLHENQIPFKTILEMFYNHQFHYEDARAVIKTAIRLHEKQVPPEIISGTIALLCAITPPSDDISEPLEMFFATDSKTPENEWLNPKKWAEILPKVEDYLREFPEHQIAWEYLLNLKFNPNVDPITLQITDSTPEQQLPKSLLMTQSETLKSMINDISSSDPDLSLLKIPISCNVSDQAKQKFFLCLKEGLKGKSQDYLSSKEDQIDLYHLAEFYNVWWMQDKLQKALVNNFDFFEIYKVMDFSHFTSNDLTKFELFENSPHKGLYINCILRLIKNMDLSTDKQYQKLVNFLKTTNDTLTITLIDKFLDLNKTSLGRLHLEQFRQRLLES